jgi:hypothetical protein
MCPERRPKAPGATDLGGSSNYPSDNPWGLTWGRFPGQTAIVPGSAGPEPPVRNLDRGRPPPAGPSRPPARGRGGDPPGGVQRTHWGRKGSRPTFLRHLSTALKRRLAPPPVMRRHHPQGILPSPHPGTRKAPAPEPVSNSEGGASWGERASLWRVRAGVSLLEKRVEVTRLRRRIGDRTDIRIRTPR